MKRLIFVTALLVTATLSSAKVITRGIAYKHAGVKLEGYLAYDDAKVFAKSPAPGVLVAPEWWG
jgi:hypothetical protein